MRLACKADVDSRVVGHVTREFSRPFWYFFTKINDGEVTCEIMQQKALVKDSLFVPVCQKEETHNIFCKLLTN